MSKIINTTSSNIDTLKEGVSFVTFSAPWCGPCRMLSPLIEELSTEMTNIKFGKVDVDVSRNLAEEYGIKSIPTMYVLKDGEIKQTFVGVVAISKIKEALTSEI